MRDNKRTNLYILGALLLGVVSISIGFAAFSNTLKIQSQANVTPDESTFKVVFSSDGTTYKTDPVPGTPTGAGVTVDNGTIDNTTNPTITGLHASFKSPGQKAVYNFFVHNKGDYLAHLNSITFKGSKTCTAGNGATQSLVDAACSSITMKVEIGSLSVTETTQNITGETIEAGAFEPISVTIEYASNGPRVDGAFEIGFPDVSLYYGTTGGTNEEYVAPSPTPTPTPTSTVKYVVSSTTMRIGWTVDTGVNLRNTAAEAMADWGSITGTQGDTFPFYLKHKINSNNKIEESYAGFVVTPEMAQANPGMIAGTYTLKGGDGGASYQDNINVIKTAFDYANHPDRCYVNSSDINCHVSGLSADAFSDGYVGASDDVSHGCYVRAGGSSDCS